MKNNHLNTLVVLALATMLEGCGTLSPRIDAAEKSINQEIKTVKEKAPEQVPVTTSTSGSWLAGAPLQIAEPVLPILNQAVGYHPTRPVLMSDVASWITQNTGLVVDIAELQPSLVSGATNSPTGNSSTSPTSNSSTSSTGINGSSKNIYVNYSGTLSGLLDITASKSGSWWKIVDGRVVYYKSITKTFYLPAIARRFIGESTITTSTGASGSGSSSSSGISSTGGINSGSNYLVDIWADLDKTAKTVAAGAQVSVNESAGSITITGTPFQVRHMEDWVKDLSSQLSQQVSISLQIYNVKLNNEDNYNWDPAVIFKSATGVLGYSLSGIQSPAVTSGTTPLSFGVSVLNNALSGKTTQYSGSQLAFKALSTIGHVTEKINRTVITLNGQPVPIQVANIQGYLASSTTTITSSVGATTALTPGSITTGFTAMLLPRIVNGKVILSMAMSQSSSNGFTSISSGGSTIQNPNVDSNTFQQSVSLTPDSALLLTDLQQDNTSSINNGVGTAKNYALGGGADKVLNKQIQAIVITARIL